MECLETWEPFQQHPEVTVRLNSDSNERGKFQAAAFIKLWIIYIALRAFHIVVQECVVAQPEATEKVVVGFNPSIP